MTRATYRFREYTIGPDQRPEAESHTCTLQYVACEVARVAQVARGRCR
jgi:hypothetical protein